MSLYRKAAEQSEPNEWYSDLELQWLRHTSYKRDARKKVTKQCLQFFLLVITMILLPMMIGYFLAGHLTLNWY